MLPHHRFSVAQAAKTVITRFRIHHLLLGFFLLGQLVATTNQANAQNYIVDDNYPQTDGDVRTTSRVNNTIYISGFFNHVGFAVGQAGLMDTSSGAITKPFPTILGDVNAIISDGSGGYYLGGAFTTVAGVARTGLVHLNSDFTVDANFTATVTGTVHALELSGTNLYVGGLFTALAGSPATNFGVVSTTTSTLQSLSPAPDGVVRAIEISGTRLFIAGDFNNVFSTARVAIASINLTNGTLESWNPVISGTVNDIVVSGSNIYCGGSFSAVNSTTRNNLAQINTTTGVLTSFNPNVGSSVSTLALSGSVLYLGGQFFSVSSTTRQRIASVDATTGALTSFNPVADGHVKFIAVANNSVYAGGTFSQIGGQQRSSFAKLSLSGVASTFEYGTSGLVNVIVPVGNKVLLGGTFGLLKAVRRTSVAALDLNTYQVKPWKIVTNGLVNKHLYYNGKIYIFGAITNINSTTRTRMASMDTLTGALTSWAPTASALVEDAVNYNDQIYIAGQFTVVNGTARRGIARLDANTGTLHSWDAASNATCWHLLIHKDKLYVGGAFTSMSGSTRNNACAFKLSDMSLTSWNPNPNGQVFSLHCDNTNIYLSGEFSTLGGSSQTRIGKVDTLNGTRVVWPANLGSRGFSLNKVGNTILAGGLFTTAGSFSRPYLAAFDSTTGEVAPVATSANNSIYDLAFIDNKMRIGGSFTTFESSSTVRHRSAAVELPCPDQPTITVGGPTSFCSGGSVTLTGPTGFGYRWSNGATTKSISVTTSGTYTLQTILFGCTSAVSLPVVVTVTQTPSQPTITAGGPTTFCTGGSVTLTAPAGFSYLWSNAATTQSINVTTAGSYTVRTITGTCTSSLSAATVVTVNTPPTTPTITADGPTTFCNGGSVTLTAPAGFSYLWSTSETTQSINVTTAGSYTVQTIASGCTSTASAATVVTVNTPPTTPTITADGPTTFCTSGSVTLTAPAGFSYLWSTSETTQSINVTTAGSYTVQTIASGCTSTASAATVVTVTACNAKVYTGIGNWTDAANWSGGTLPVSTDSVLVSPLSVLTMNTTATVKSITVAATATLTMNATSDLTVTNVAENLGTVNNSYGLTGSLRLGGGSFPTEFKGNKWSANRVILLSNAKANGPLDVFSGLDLNGKTFNVNNKAITLRFGGPSSYTAELLQPAGSALTNANSFKVDKRYPISLSTTGTNGGAWILVGAPVSNQNVNTWSQGNAYAFSWQNGIANGSSIYTYDPFYTLPLSRGYKKPTGPTQVAPIGVGHRVWFSKPLFFDGPNQGGQTYTGAPHIGSFTWNLAYCVTGCADTTAPYGYNMISNPFAATIDWDAPTGWTRINVYNAMYIHKSLTQNVASYVNGVGNNGGSRYLPVGQGFFVWSDAVGANMTATPEVIAPGVQVAQLRSGQTVDVLRFNVSFNNGIADEAVIRFDQRATPLFDDQLEARKMSNSSGLNFAFLNANNERIAINAENMPTTQTIYPMSLAVPRTGNYTIDFSGMATLTNSNWSVFLKDNDLNTLILVQDGQVYSFNQSAGSTTRFSLVVMPQGPTSLGNQVKLALNIVPNPGRDVVRVNLSQTTNGLITVTNQIGQVVMSEMVNGTSHELNVSKLAQGIYHVAVGGVVTKLVVE